MFIFQELEGLLYYLKYVILDVNFGKEADDMFTPIADFGQYVNGIINFFNQNPNLNQEPIIDDLKNSLVGDSPFNSGQNFLYVSDEMSGPPSLLLTVNGDDSLDTSIVEKDETKVANGSPMNSLTDTNSFGQTFADLVLDIFNVFDPAQIAHFVLKNSVIREYATNKIINILYQRNPR